MVQRCRDSLVQNSMNVCTTHHFSNDQVVILMLENMSRVKRVYASGQIVSSRTEGCFSKGRTRLQLLRVLHLTVLDCLLLTL